MGKVLLEEQSLIDIANSIRNKTGSSETMTPSEMATNIDNISANVGTKTITQNGIYNASDDNLDGYSQVDVKTNGVDLSEYFNETIMTGSSLAPGYSQTIKKLPRFTFSGDSCAYMFSSYKGTHIDMSGIDITNTTTLTNMFAYDYELKELDLSHFVGENVTNVHRMFYSDYNLTKINLRNFKPNNLTNAGYLFFGCNRLKFVDMRSCDFTKITSFTNFNSGLSSCELIVADDIQKQWFIDKNLTSGLIIKTVAEYESEGNV